MAHWSNLLCKIVREFPTYYPWLKIKPEKKVGVIGTIRQHFYLTSHIQSKLWLKIGKGIEHHLAKIYVDNKSSFKKEHWVLQPEGMRDVEGIRSRPYPNIKQPDWDKHIDFWLDDKNAARALQNAQNRTKSKVFCRQGFRSHAVIRDMQIFGYFYETFRQKFFLNLGPRWVLEWNVRDIGIVGIVGIVGFVGIVGIYENLRF
ncbi:hypothetical protein Tco_0870703 [Tanacetum coccineum]